MSYATPTLGMSPEELQNLVSAMLGPTSVTSGEIDEGWSPQEYVARRVALEAAAALIATNNRRLTEQLARLGVPIASVTQPASAASRPPASGAPLTHD